MMKTNSGDEQELKNRLKTCKDLKIHILNDLKYLKTTPSDKVDKSFMRWYRQYDKKGM